MFRFLTLFLAFVSIPTEATLRQSDKLMHYMGYIRVALCYEDKLDKGILHEALLKTLKEMEVLTRSLDLQSMLFSHKNNIEIPVKVHPGRPPSMFSNSGDFSDFYPVMSEEEALFRAELNYFEGSDATLLTLCVSHVVADAGSVAAFISAWSNNCDLLIHDPDNVSQSSKVKNQEADALRIQLLAERGDISSALDFFYKQMQMTYVQKSSAPNYTSQPKMHLTRLLTIVQGSPRSEGYIDGDQLDKLTLQLRQDHSEFKKCSSTAVLIALILDSLVRVSNEELECDILKDLRRVLHQEKHIYAKDYIGNAFALVNAGSFTSKDNFKNILLRIHEKLQHAEQDAPGLLYGTDFYEYVGEYIKFPAILPINTFFGLNHNKVLFSSWRGEHMFLDDTMGTGKKPKFFRLDPPKCNGDKFFAIYPIAYSKTGKQHLGLHFNLNISELKDAFIAYFNREGAPLRLNFFKALHR